MFHQENNKGPFKIDLMNTYSQKFLEGVNVNWRYFRLKNGK